MIKEHYRHDKSDEKFENVVDAVKDAYYHSQINDNAEVAVKRCVMYTHADDWTETTLARIQMPESNTVRIEESNINTVHSNLRDTMRHDDSTLTRHNPDIEMF